MWIRILSFVLLVGFGATQQRHTECRVCPESCITFPREDGGCQICICDGVAKSDCERTTCQAGCRKELDTEGCNACVCDPICPAVRECPEGCDHKIDNEGCIECDCGDNSNVCEAVPACAKGCIDMRMDTKCFSCNCTLQDDSFGGQGGSFGVGGFGGRPFSGRPNNGNPFRGNAGGRNPILETFFGGNTFGGNSFGGGTRGNNGGFNTFNNNDRRRPIAPTPNRPFNGFLNENSFNVASGAQTSTCPAVDCPRNCRIGMDDDGCRQCLCGDDAFMCPGVDQCFGRCLNTNPETNCCQCTCIDETADFVNGGGSFGTTLIFTPNGVTAIITPGNGFNVQRRPGNRPGQRPGLRPGQGPILPNEEEADVFSPEFPPNNFNPQNNFNPTGQNPFNTNNNIPFNQNIPNQANPNGNGNNPPFINPVNPTLPAPANPAIDPNVNNNNNNNNNNNPTNLDPIIPGVVEPQNIPDVDPVIPGVVDPQNLPNDVPNNPEAVEPQNPSNIDCPSVEEVTCGGNCAPRAGPDGCPVCDCGLLTRIRPRPVIIVDENAPPGVFANADAEANGEAAVIPPAGNGMQGNGEAAI